MHYHDHGHGPLAAAHVPFVLLLLAQTLPHQLPSARPALDCAALLQRKKVMKGKGKRE